MRNDLLSREARAFFAAAAFLTRVHVPMLSTDDSWRNDLKRGLRYFPLVGGLVGLATGGLFWALCLIFPAPIAALLALAFEALLTGAFHEDALADFCDAFGGGVTADQARTILKDSRLGSYGALGLLLGVSLRAFALMSLIPLFAIFASAAAGALSRFSAICAMRLLPPAADRASLSKDIGSQPSNASMLFGFVVAAAFLARTALGAPAQALLGVAASAAIILLIVSMMKHKLGGTVGDGLGAIVFVSQTLFLVCLLATF